MKKFIITIDTEGDNLWDVTKAIETKNAGYIERFQDICEKYHMIPTYLVNYEMAMDETFVEFAAQKAKENKCEIGMHLHAWNSPPVCKLGRNTGVGRDYLIEYPEEVMRQKIYFLTAILRNKFDQEIVSHRAGRWAINGCYMKILKEAGYIVDCSVTPHTNWSKNPGYQKEFVGTDFRRFPTRPYEMDLNDIRKEGKSGIFEVPMTVKRGNWFSRKKSILENAIGIKKKIQGYGNLWMRPDGTNCHEMLELLKSGEEYIEFMIHSSEFMPGGSPTFDTEEKIERLFDDLEKIFREACKEYQGISLTNYAKGLRKAENSEK